MRQRTAWIVIVTLSSTLALVTPSPAEAQFRGSVTQLSYGPTPEFIAWRHWVMRLESSIFMQGGIFQRPQWHGNTPQCEIYFVYGGVQCVCIVRGYNYQITPLG